MKPIKPLSKMSIFDVRNIVGRFNSKFVITLPSINLSRTQKVTKLKILLKLG